MKTYEKMASDALGRINDYEEKQKKSRKTFAKIVTPAASLCLAAVVGFGIVRSGMPGNVPPVTGSENSNISEQSDTEKKEIISKETEDKGGQTEDAGCFTLWKEKINLCDALYDAITKNPDGVFSIIATYSPAYNEYDSIIYEGKTLAELDIAAEYEKHLPDRMKSLLDSGEDLKYGTALYETGNPDGIKWAKTLYDERVSSIGEELIEKYIVDGNFLREELEKAIAALPTIDVTDSDGNTTKYIYNGEDSARKQFSLAYDACRKEALTKAASSLSDIGIECRFNETENGIIFTADAELLENIPFEKLKNWSFDLAFADTKGVADDEAVVSY